MNDRDDTTRPAGGVSPGPPPASGPSAHEPPPGASLMNLLRWALFAGLLVLAAVSIGSYAMSRRSGGSASEQKQARYYCPMHPSYTSDRPGECPICGMTLEPIPAGGIGAAPTAQAGDVPGLTSVHIAPDRVQLIGIRTARVERRPLGGQLELVGFVTPDETRLSRVQIRVAGWVQELFVNRTGDRVSVGEPLLAIYSPELYQSEQEYLIEGGGMDSVAAPTPGHEAGGGHEAGAAASARKRLTLLGVPAEELQRLDRTHLASPRLTLRSTVSGTVLERNVTQGQYVTADTPLFSIADLSRVWVLADLYEMDMSRVKAGDRAAFTADALTGGPRDGRVEFAYPTVSPETRTLKVRLSLDNRDGLLRPGMYGRVRIAGRGGQALVVPDEAVIDAGEHQYVFLAHPGGHFEPRMVWTGTRDGDRVQIVKGIAEGDTVVASASFLIDSESRLKAAIAGMGSQPGGAHKH